MNAGSEERAREGIAEICGHYLGAPASEEDARLVYTCPSCEGDSFAANLVTRKAGCWTGRCPPGRYADALELVSHFDDLSNPPEILERAREILTSRVVEPPSPEKNTTTADRAGSGLRYRGDDRREHEAHHSGEPSRGREPHAAPSESEGGANACGDGGAEAGGLARSREEGGEDEPGAAEEGWYAVLAAPEDAHSGPEVYRPAGALQPLSSSVASGGELLAALVAFAVTAACVWTLVEQAGPPLYAVGLPEAAGILARHEAACALCAGTVASLAVWAFLSGRRHAERRHLGDDRERPSAKKSTAAGPSPTRAPARGAELDKREERT